MRSRQKGTYKQSILKTAVKGQEGVTEVIHKELTREQAH